MSKRCERLIKTISKYMNRPRLDEVAQDVFGAPWQAANLFVVVAEMVRDAERQGKLEELVSALKKANGGPDFAEALDRDRGLNGVPLGGRPRCYDTPLLMDQPLMDRDTLRKSLFDLLEGSGGVRLLVVNGEHPGKSYCCWLIKHVAAEVGFNEPECIDLLDIANVRELQETLVDKLNLPYDEWANRFTTEVREAKFFNNWLEGKSRSFASGRRHLLVFDHLNKVGVPKDLVDFVVDLAKRALESALTNIWIVLLDTRGHIYEVLDAPGRYRSETIAPIQKTDVDAFLSWAVALRREAGAPESEAPPKISDFVQAPFPLTKAQLQTLQRGLSAWLAKP